MSGRVKLSVLVLLILSTPLAHADDRLAIWHNVDDAIAAARRDDRPLMFYVVNRKVDGRDRRRQKHRDAFASPDVARAAAPFICVELPADRVPAEGAQWGLPAGVDGHVVFATPSGRKVHDCAIGSPDRFAEQVELGYERFAEYIWSFELAPVFERGRGDRSKLLDAAQRVARHRVRAAETDLLNQVDSLSRPSSAPASSSGVGSSADGGAREVRPAMLKALARIGTTRAIEWLVQHCEGDPDVRQALGSVDGPGVELLAGHLDAGRPDRTAAIYEAVARAAGLRNPKAAGFWQKAPESERLAEIRRAQEAARQVAWRSRLRPD